MALFPPPLFISSILSHLTDLVVFLHGQFEASLKVFIFKNAVVADYVKIIMSCDGLVRKPVDDHAPINSSVWTKLECDLIVYKITFQNC